MCNNMKSLNCYEVCGVDCGYVAKGMTDREVIRVMFRHGEIHHRELLEDMNEKQRQKIVNKMHDMVREIQDSRRRLY